MKYLIALSLVLLSACAGKDGTTGAIGPDGPPGADSNQLIEVIKPCDGPAVLMRFSNGVLIGHFSHGNRHYLMEMEPGEYETDDGNKCKFVVNPDMTVVW